ncbi:hypothetical protein GOBAR_AA03415 [Gossypium barbadense]|uniref:Uncharacterized protein n=1 Tax=Gossypium barbadense TaxID=3634 RepID=A0A2P5YNJ5_GOSBA|nr:hypothetical protein GOBAR_AA03415 [Gossypium barbadense]
MSARINLICCNFSYALRQSDGRWRFSSNNPESNAFAVGIALETLAGVVSLASLELDQSLQRQASTDEQISQLRAEAAAREAEQNRKYNELQLQLQSMMTMFQQFQNPPS